MNAQDAILTRFAPLHPKKIDLSLGRIERLLADLGSPQRSLPPVVHVAGTNGKGSTVAYLRTILEAAGHRVHAFTSPYLVRLNECYRIGRYDGGVLVDDAELEKRRAALKPAGTPAWAKRGYAYLFNETILQADEGCDFDFMRGQGKG